MHVEGGIGVFQVQKKEGHSKEKGTECAVVLRHPKLGMLGNK